LEGGVRNKRKEKIIGAKRQEKKVEGIGKSQKIEIMGQTKRGGVFGNKCGGIGGASTKHAPWEFDGLGWNMYQTGGEP